MADVGDINANATFARSTTAGDRPAAPIPREDVPVLREPQAEAPAPKSEPEEQQTPFDQQSIQDQVRKLNKQAENQSLEFRYGVREATGDFFVQVLDSSRREVVRTIPFTNLLELRERIQAQVGLIVDEEA